MHEDEATRRNYQKEIPWGNVRKSLRNVRFERNGQMDEPEGRARMEQPDGLKGNPWRQSLRGLLKGEAKRDKRNYVIKQKGFSIKYGLRQNALKWNNKNEVPERNNSRES